jgi:glycosyltransferase involved in cell wall biosynthesis
LRIAQIASIAFSVPPRAHGGTEIAIDTLTRGLVARGHDVTLFASGDSQTTARLHAVVPRATQDDPSATSYLEREYEVRNVAEAYRLADRFDVLHSHWPTPAAYFSSTTPSPSFMTYAYIEKPLHDYYRSAYPRLHGVSITAAQNRMLGGGLPVIPYGVELDRIPFVETPEAFLVTVGRMVQHKGADRAIAIARKAGLPLVIVGAVTPYLAESEPFFRERVEPHVDGRSVVHYPHLPNADAMAAGTPVIATPRGALPELVEHGVTGFLGDGDEELAGFAVRAGEISRAACRRRAQERFSAERMVSDYEALYRRILAS